MMVEGREGSLEFGYFSHDDVQSLRSVAAQLAAAIKRCRLIQRSRATVRMIRYFQRLTEELDWFSMSASVSEVWSKP